MLNRTGQTNVTYIGHSQGTMQMFAALIENSEFFKSRINLCIMLAPVTRVKKLAASVLQKMKNVHTLASMMESIGPELLPNP